MEKLFKIILFFTTNLQEFGNRQYLEYQSNTTKQLLDLVQVRLTRLEYKLETLLVFPIIHKFLFWQLKYLMRLPILKLKLVMAQMLKYLGMHPMMEHHKLRAILL